MSHTHSVPTPPNTNPPINLRPDTPIRTSAILLVGLISLTITMTLAWANLSREVAEQTRVNNAQDKRFENIEAAQADLAIIRNNVQWLQRAADARALKYEPRHE